MKHKKGKKKRAKKKRRYVTSSDSETSSEEEQSVKARLKDCHLADLARAAYQNNIDRVRSDIVYKSIFPFLN